MNKILLEFFSFLILIFFLVSCTGYQNTPGGLVGGVGDKPDPAIQDQMIQHQKKEEARQEKELQDVKRQEFYNQKYRQHLKDY